MQKKDIKTDELQYANQVTQTLYNIANAVNTTSSLEDLYLLIHHSLGRVMDVTNFFIAMVNQKEKTLFFPYQVDIEDDDFGPITDFDTHNSLTGMVVLKKAPLLLKKEELQKRASQNGVWGPVPVIWMGVPLRVKGEIIGVVTVQSYTDPECYTKKDLDLLISISDQIAVAIDRKQAEERLHKSEKRYRILFEKSKDALLIIKNQKFIDCNQATLDMLGYDNKELMLQTHPSDLSPRFQPDGRDSFTKAVEMIEITLENGSHRFEWNHVRANGDIFPVEVLLTVVSIEEGNQVIHTTWRDITEKKLAQIEKNRVNQLAAEQEKHALVGRVAGKMAHDFNNILGVIMGNTELALLDCPDEEIKKTLELIYGQTIRGKNLTKNLTAFAKNQEPRHEFLKINDVMDFAMNLLKKDLEEIEVIKEYHQGLPDLLADPGMIEHALVNLLQNSIHALSKAQNPRIIIRTSCNDKYICFEIEDNGCGIPREDIKDIFEPSFTLKGGNDLTGSYLRNIKGTGYGMSNVKRYIEQHNGKVTLNSQVNIGTTFFIRLPVIRQRLLRKEKTDLRKSQLATGKHILLVEDEPAISNVQYRILSQDPCNHRVDLAMNGQMAIDLFTRNKYDLVSLDYQLPGRMNGMDVYKLIRKKDKTTPILFVSGNLEFLESIDKLKRHQNIAYLSKPCPNKVYVDTINQLFWNKDS
ncbi:MAG: response regulator [Desulfobacula sp.]|nr:response regulator [Desulfobacula sp.]